jgi:hypothetical protein
MSWRGLEPALLWWTASYWTVLFRELQLTSKVKEDRPQVGITVLHLLLTLFIVYKQLLMCWVTATCFLASSIWHCQFSWKRALNTQKLNQSTHIPKYLNAAEQRNIHGTSSIIYFICPNISCSQKLYGTEMQKFPMSFLHYKQQSEQLRF